LLSRLADPQDLVVVGDHRHRAVAEVRPGLRVVARRARRARPLRAARRRARRHVERHAAGLELRQIEQIVDEPDQAFGVGQRDPEQLTVFVGQAVAAAGEPVAAPRTDVEWVRSSWLAVETNSLFIRSRSDSAVTSV
jgi:hypothetical protein